MTSPVIDLPPAAAPHASAPPAALRRVVVEGWRGVNHSFGMVNQHQLLALSALPGLALYHRDMPFFMKHWSPGTLPAGFAEDEARRIAAVPAPPEGLVADTLLRLVSPFATGFTPGQRTLSFMVTECALVDACFDRPIGCRITGPADTPAAREARAAFTRDGNLILTPSHWSRARIADDGFDAARIVVVPHGVAGGTFRPLAPVERRLTRQALGIGDGEVLFLNVGVATWNKGLDFLVEAFAHVRKRHRHARLMLKQNAALYGLKVERTVAEVQRTRPGLIDADVLAGISVLTTALDQPQLRALYGVADAYVSPYRAEGFNLPALEAMACGTPVLVTDGGATDDFCPPALARRIAARDGTRADAPEEVGPFRVPSVEALVAEMNAIAEGARPADAATMAAERDALVERMAWPAVTRQLAALL